MYFAAAALIATVLFFNQGVDVSTDLMTYYHHDGLFYVWPQVFGCPGIHFKLASALFFLHVL